MIELAVILAITIALFDWGKYPPDAVALMSMLALYLTGILNMTETLSGFSNPTVVMIAALFIVGEGLTRTGCTGTVAALLPVTVSAAWKAGTLPSKLLMPVAFGSNTGGLLTWTGTPPNIIVSNTLTQKGLSGFSFFEFALIGLALLLIAIVYLRYIGYRQLPDRQTELLRSTLILKCMNGLKTTASEKICTACVFVPCRN